MENRINLIFKAANAVIPEWKESGRNNIQTYARVLVVRKLRNIGITYKKIGSMLGVNHSTAVHYMTIYKEPMQLLYMRDKFDKELQAQRVDILKRTPCDTCVSQECKYCDFKL